MKKNDFNWLKSLLITPFILSLGCTSSEVKLLSQTLTPQTKSSTSFVKQADNISGSQISPSSSTPVNSSSVSSASTLSDNQKLAVVDVIVTPDILQIEQSQSRTPTVDIKLANGLTASLKLNQLEWQSTNENIVKVQGGIIRGESVGQALVTTKVGNMSKTIAVSVIPSANTSSSSTDNPDASNPSPLSTDNGSPPTPTPTPTPIDTRPPLERIDSVQFTQDKNPVGLKVSPVFMSSSGDTVNWEWEGAVKIHYSIFDRERNWELTTDADATLTKDKPFFVAEGDFDSVHEILIKGNVDMTYQMTLPNGKKLSGKRVPITGGNGSSSTSSSVTPAPTAQPTP